MDKGVTFLRDHRYHKNANAVFRMSQEDFEASDFESEKWILKLEKFINRHRTEQLPRLQELKRYYLADNNIKYRPAKTDEFAADNRIASDFSRYITIFEQGYMLGKSLANTNASKLLQNTTIKSYIEQKLKEIQINKHLSMEEALAITASIAKGEPQRFEVVKRDPETDEIIEREVSEYSAGFKERNQALEHYYKINAAFIDKQKVEITEAPTFIDDISGEGDG